MTTSNETNIAALRAAAADGSPDALHRLATALVASLDMEEAFATHARAAAVGHVGSLIESGRMLMYGIGTPSDIARAVQAFSQAEAANAPGSAIAGYFLALIALGNTALPRDAKIGERLLAAVQAGHPPALRAAAIHFGRKPNLQDQSTCIQLLDHAAGRGDAIAAQLLAERVRRGEGCTAQPESAAQLKAKLREGGFPDLPEIVAVPAAPRKPSPPSTLALDEVLEPPPAEVVSESPRIERIDGLLSVDECRLLVATAQPMLSTAQDGAEVSIDPLFEDLSLRLVQLRLAAAAGSDLVNAEFLRISQAAPDQPGTPPVEGRARVVHAFLTTPVDVPPPDDDRAVEAKAGRAVVAEPAGADLAPQRAGAGWLATLWLHARPLRPY